MSGPAPALVGPQHLNFGTFRMDHSRGRGQAAGGRGSRNWTGAQPRGGASSKSAAPSPAPPFPTAASLFSKTFPPPRATAPATKLGKWNLPYPSIDLFSSLYHPAMEDAGTDATGVACARPGGDAANDPLGPEDDGPHPNARLLSSAFGPYNLPATAALTRSRVSRTPQPNELLPNLDDVMDWSVAIDGTSAQILSAATAVSNVLHSNPGIQAAPICTCGSGLAVVSLGVHAGVAAPQCAVHRDQPLNVVRERPPRRPRRLPRTSSALNGGARGGDDDDAGADGDGPPARTSGGRLSPFPTRASPVPTRAFLGDAGSRSSSVDEEDADALGKTVEDAIWPVTFRLRAKWRPLRDIEGHLALRADAVQRALRAADLHDTSFHAALQSVYVKGSGILRSAYGADGGSAPHSEEDGEKGGAPTQEGDVDMAHGRVGRARSASVGGGAKANGRRDSGRSRSATADAPPPLGTAAVGVASRPIPKAADPMNIAAALESRRPPAAAGRGLGTSRTGSAFRTARGAPEVGAGGEGGSKDAKGGGSGGDDDMKGGDRSTTSTPPVVGSGASASEGARAAQPHTPGVDSPAVVGVLPVKGGPAALSPSSPNQPIAGVRRATSPAVGRGGDSSAASEATRASTPLVDIVQQGENAPWRKRVETKWGVYVPRSPSVSSWSSVDSCYD